MIRLPVSGLHVDARPPGGAEDILLWDTPSPDRALALALVGRLTSVPEPAALSVHDFEALLMHLHGLVFGGMIYADATCPCRQRIDLSFAARDFVEARRPRHPRHVAPAKEAGWFTLAGEEGAFRLPTIGDQIAVSAAPDPVVALAARCLRGPRVSPRIERAMAALAPALSGELAGTCPYCASRVALYFDVPTFVLSELKVQSALVCEDVHLLAGHYHWSEDHILALPPARRRRYVDLVSAERGLG